ncbi:MFS transporter, partial [Aliarcobacter butzleri]
FHKPYSIPFPMFCTFIGFTSLAFATNFYLILVSAILIGIGSSIFHPEASRTARMAASGEK